MSQHQWVPETQFLDASIGVYARSWLPRPWGLLSWGFRRLGILGVTSQSAKLKFGRYIIISNVEVCFLCLPDNLAYGGDILTINLESGRLCSIADGEWK